MGLSERRKGTVNERQLVTILRAVDPSAHRVPLSGAVDGYPGDIKALGMTWESKVRADGNGFKQLYTWLEGRDALAVRMDRQEWLVVMPLRTFLQLLGEQGGRSDEATA